MVHIVREISTTMHETNLGIFVVWIRGPRSKERWQQTCKREIRSMATNFVHAFEHIYFVAGRGNEVGEEAMTGASCGS
jgi:hypothetical protein